MSNQVPITYAGKIHVSTTNTPVPLWPHQKEAIEAMSKTIPVASTRKFAGLLVIPTGGGKTMIAIRWILRNLIDRRKKVLWIAHRHELLEQAFLTVRNNACKDGVLPNTTTFRYRIISGQHGKPVHLQPNDDIVIASKDSLNRGIGHLLNKWLTPDEEVFLVIDEAHHATAKTYRKLVEKLSDNRILKVLGLTATAFRTLEKEKGLLGRVFSDDIVYKIDLRTLIAQGILAEPTFETLETSLNFSRTLTEKDLRTIAAFDELPDGIALQIAASNERNKQIVDRYIDNHAEYGQLLVFAVNVAHAITLNEIFNVELNKRFRTVGKHYSEYVVGDIVEKATGVRISSKETKEKIERFRQGQTLVLVNVQILTEGTDLPNAKTVFLTRPTMSTVLMTQMIGRVLRGEKVGGKEKAYVVSFIDDWEDKVAWVSPEKVCVEKCGGFIDTPAKSSDNILRLVAVEKIQEFSRMMHEQVPELERLEFLARLPVGIYSFSVFVSDQVEKNCEVLVFDHMREAFANFVDDLPELFKLAEVPADDGLDDAELERLFSVAMDGYFWGHDEFPRYREDDVKNILRYYAQAGEAPTFLEFTDRAKYDIGREAKDLFNNAPPGKWGRRQDKLWEDPHGFWQVLFGHRKEFFVRQFTIEIEKLIHPPGPVQPVEPFVEPQRVEMAELSLWEIREIDSKYWRWLHDAVFAKCTDGEGVISCAMCAVKSKHRIRFQIDHIKPREDGGLSVVENLQVLCRRCHIIKTTGNEPRGVDSGSTPVALPSGASVKPRPGGGKGSGAVWPPMLPPISVVPQKFETSEGLISIDVGDESRTVKESDLFFRINTLSEVTVASPPDDGKSGKRGHDRRSRRKGT